MSTYVYEEEMGAEAQLDALADLKRLQALFEEHGAAGFYDGVVAIATGDPCPGIGDEDVTWARPAYKPGTRFKARALMQADTLRSRAVAFLERIENITTESFSRGGDQVERGALQAFFAEHGGRN